jgi:hypothetical protein
MEKNNRNKLIYYTHIKIVVGNDTEIISFLTGNNT